MKAILKFDLSDADDSKKFKMASQASEMYHALWEIKHNYRKQIDWHLDSNPEMTAQDMADYILMKIITEIEENDLII